VSTIPLHPEGDRAFCVGDLDYEVPPELIAQEPATRREDARMLVLDRAADSLVDAGVADLPSWLRPGDLLVLNDTKVLPAKLLGRKPTGAWVEGLFLAELRAGLWRVMWRGSRRLRTGERLTLGDGRATDVSLTLRERCGPGEWLTEVDPPCPAEELLNKVGQTPLPPYIHRATSGSGQEASDRDRYQTVFARRPGAVAAPTAGLHLTEGLLAQAKARQADVAYVTLHVGIGTFRPLRVERLDEHVMHTEWFDLPPPTASAVAACRDRGSRVVAVGTTCVRVLEATACPDDRRLVTAQTGGTALFIRPPFRFGAVDALLTNFHWPRSTLLALVMAFAGVERVQRAYEHAIAHRYRLFSFGDAMFIC